MGDDTLDGGRARDQLSFPGLRQGVVVRLDLGWSTGAGHDHLRSIETVFGSIHQANPDPMVMAYQYLQTLPQIAQGEGNTVWMIPSEVTSALKMVSRAFEGAAPSPGDGPPPAAASAAPASTAPASTEPAALSGPAVTPNGLAAPAGGRQGSEPDGEAEGQ